MICHFVSLLLRQRSRTGTPLFEPRVLHLSTPMSVLTNALMNAVAILPARSSPRRFPGQISLCSHPRRLDGDLVQLSPGRESGSYRRHQRAVFPSGIPPGPLRLLVEAAGRSRPFGSRTGLSPTKALRNSSCGIYFPMTTRQTVRGVDNINPAVPHNQVQKTAANSNAKGDTPILAP
jgi:hypothetical protein